MKSKYLGILALVVGLPGGIPIMLGAWGYRAIHRAIMRRRVKRIVVAVGQGRPAWKSQIVKS